MVDHVVYNGREVYINLYLSYKVMLDEARDDFTSYYILYNESKDKFFALRNSIIRIKIMEIFNTYLAIVLT
jgi:hypothetical protein